MYWASPSWPRYGSVRPAKSPVTVETSIASSERRMSVSRSRSPNAVYARRMSASPLIAMKAGKLQRRERSFSWRQFWDLRGDLLHHPVEPVHLGVEDGLAARDQAAGDPALRIGPAHDVDQPEVPEGEVGV